MRKKEIEIAEQFGILERVKRIEADLLKIKYVEGVEFDLFGFYDNLEQVIVLTKYDVPFASDTYFADRALLKLRVIDTMEEHGLSRTVDSIEDYGAHFYFVFRITDKERFYGKVEEIE